MPQAHVADMRRRTGHCDLPDAEAVDLVTVVVTG